MKLNFFFCMENVSHSCLVTFYYLSSVDRLGFSGIMGNVVLVFGRHFAEVHFLELTLAVSIFSCLSMVMLCTNISTWLKHTQIEVVGKPKHKWV